MMPYADPFRCLFEMNPQPMWIFDPQTRKVVELNQAAVHKYGYSREEFLSLPVDAIFPFKPAGAANDTDFSGAWPHRTKQGKTFAADVIQTGVCFGGLKAVLLTSREMVARRWTEYEQELRLAIAELISKGDLDLIVDALHALSEWSERDDDAIVAVDRDFKVIYWNHAAEVLFGRQSREVYGKEYNIGTGRILEENASSIEVQLVQTGTWKGVITCTGPQGKRLIVDTFFFSLARQDWLCSGLSRNSP